MMSLQMMTSQGAMTSQGGTPGSGCGWNGAGWVGFHLLAAPQTPSSWGWQDWIKLCSGALPYLSPPHA